MSEYEKSDVPAQILAELRSKTNKTMNITLGFIILTSQKSKKYFGNQIFSEVYNAQTTIFGKISKP